MSRRDSRTSINAKHNDALTEFENFKKKFLLANKHITKLNSTLSVRIEELQAEISTLYVENLRLRASEIALATQLKKEQEKSKRILADAEAATSNLSKHLGFLRQSLTITPNTPSPTLEPKPPPKARKPTSDLNASPLLPRLSRAPNFPGIFEDDEVASSPEAEEDDVVHVNSSARRRSKEKPLMPPRVASSPHLVTPVHIHLVERESTAKRKSSRRQSGLLSVNTEVGTSMRSERHEGPVHPRASSPALGSPERRSAGLAEDDEERQVDELIGSGSGPAKEVDVVARARKEKRERKSKLVERDTAFDDTDLGTLRMKERKRRKEDEGSELKDVTNSPRTRTTLPPLDTRTSDRDRQCAPEMDVPTSATSIATSRTFLSTPTTTPLTTPQVSRLPTPRTSSPIPLAVTSASESETPMGGRERRTRKSVNYAEPKLNTKMRKPDPVPPASVAATVPKKRVSMHQGEETDGRTALDGPCRRPVSPLQPPAPQPSMATSTSSLAGGGSSLKRKKSRPMIPVDDDDESDGTQADAEYGNGAVDVWVNTDGRRRSGNAARGSSSLRRVLEADDARRHSLAV